MFNMMKKKAQAISFGNAPTLILLLVVIALITAAGAVGLTSFQSSQTANGYSANISGFGLSALNNFSLQLPTTGTMLGVGLILVVVIGVFAYFAKRG
jgi:hypothetical protein